MSAFYFAPGGYGFTGFWIDSKAAIVDNISEVFGANQAVFAIEVDDEVAARIEVDVAFGQFIVDRGEVFQGLDRKSVV